MNKKKKLKILESSAVQSHISMLQGIINKMSGNSANCKNLTIVLVAGILAIPENKGEQITNIWTFFIPIGLFYFLDCYYLGIERLCIESQNKFLEKIEKKKYIDSLYLLDDVQNFCKQFCNTIKAMGSVSTTPFYLIVAIVVLVFGRIIGG